VVFVGQTGLLYWATTRRRRRDRLNVVVPGQAHEVFVLPARFPQGVSNQSRPHHGIDERRTLSGRRGELHVAQRPRVYTLREPVPAERRCRRSHRQPTEFEYCPNARVFAGLPLMDRGAPAVRSAEGATRAGSLVLGASFAALKARRAS